MEIFPQISFVAAFVLFKLQHVGVEEYTLTDPLLCGPAQRQVLEVFHVSLKRLYVLCRFLKFLKHVARTFCIQWACHLAVNWLVTSFPKQGFVGSQHTHLLHNCLRLFCSTTGLRSCDTDHLA